MGEVLFVAADGGISVTRAMNERLNWEKPVSRFSITE
jgi:hypothetical protein